MIRSGSFYSGGFVQKAQVLANPSLLLSVQGYHKGAAVQWVQIHEATSANVATATIKHSFAVAPTNNFNVNVPVTGIALDKVTVALSSTADTYTAGAADILFSATNQAL